ncbi:MAG TPA: hypothetical protein VJV78_02815 [Polyangiales bacterium]|nr:hypothetical protein [Polyangiales bacterium]
MTWNSKRSLCLAALLALACNSVDPRTQVMLVADADDSMRGMIASLKLDIEGSAAGGAAADATYSQTVETHDPAGWPFRFALTPRNDEHTRRYKVTLSALDGSSNTIAVLRSECGFVKGKTLVLALRFDARCVGDVSLGCKSDETCADGKCGPASVDVNSLPPWSDGLPPTGTLGQPATAAGSGGASGNDSAAGRGGAGAGGAGTGGMSGNGSIQTGVSDCGDGLVGPEERCDTAIASGQPGACPRECMPQHCENVKLEGSGCQAQCTATPITAPLSEDGCCPPGADSSSDSDCEADCGNGKVEKGETCDPPESCPTLETCIPASACLMAVIQGDAASCSATCTMQQIAQCLPGDGCCPAGCTKAEDSDCSNSCGDGVVDPARETCEPTNPSAQCRTSCDDNNACTFDLQTGSANNCNVACTSFTISNPFPFDRCCPPGANANNDSDCAPVCGNGVVEPGERCDGVCPDAAACDDRDVCTRDAVSGTGCGKQCTHTALGPSTSGTDGCCPAGANANTDRDCQAVCGNGVVENGERCDGTNCPTEASCNDNKPCTSDVIMGSGCSRQCVHNEIGANRTTTDGCCPSGLSMDMDADCPPAPPMCGNGKVEAGEDCDGNCPTAQSCRDTDPCTEDGVTGTPCHLECSHTPIGAKVSPADQCCPAGKDRWEDADCEPRCGNMHREGNEACDGTDCPTEASCRDTNPCTEDGVTGGPCQMTCTHTPIGTNPNPDQCCPTGKDRRDDPDCKPRCGNGDVETGETCDPPNGTTCSATCQTIIPDPPPPPPGDGGLPP